jgi:hypothetical protein
VAGEEQQVRAGLGNVHRVVRNGLRGVEHHDRADRVSRGGDLGNRRHRPGHVGLLRDGHDLGPVADQRVQVGEVDTAIRRDPEPAQRGAGALAELLPGDEVRVMLELADQDLVAGADRERRSRVADRVRNILDRLFQPAIAEINSLWSVNDFVLLGRFRPRLIGAVATVGLQRYCAATARLDEPAVAAGRGRNPDA